MTAKDVDSSRQSFVNLQTCDLPFDFPVMVVFWGGTGLGAQRLIPSQHRFTKNRQNTIFGFLASRLLDFTCNQRLHNSGRACQLSQNRSHRAPRTANMYVTCYQSVILQSQLGNFTAEWSFGNLWPFEVDGIRTETPCLFGGLSIVITYMCELCYKSI